jgi:hypothetical protein
MTTFETLPRDVALNIFRFAFFPDYASLSVRELKSSLQVPTLPPPEVYVPKRDAPQVPFDPVPVGVTRGLIAVKAALHISTVSKELKLVAMDDTLWSAP